MVSSIDILVLIVRRSGQVSLGLILASILIGERPRFLLLRSSGEIWPVSAHDVQFIMPISLMPPSLTEACWSPELLQAWAQSESSSGLASETTSTTPEMMEARRKVALMLRRVQRETERMCGKLRGGTFDKGLIGGAEGVWEEWASENDSERTTITAVEAAEYILNPSSGTESQSPPIQIKPNTLPAYAAHVLLMGRPDMFVSDEGDMWATGTFIVRSKAERQRIERVQRWVEAHKSNGDDAEPLRSFVDRAKAVIALSEKIYTETEGDPLKPYTNGLPSWSSTDLDMIYTLFGAVAETRSTQTSPFLSLAIAIARLITPDPEEVVDRGTITILLQKMGMILPWDSLETSRVAESNMKALAKASTSGDIKGEGEFLQGNELDHLRIDYSDQKVYVIDDATASELDDGIALERILNSEDVWVHVHVADPTRYIPPAHPLAKRASVMGSSLYLPEGNSPLFPSDVIMRELSLGASVQRDEGRQGVITFSARVGKDGEVHDTKVNLGWIKKPRVVTYSSVDRALGLTPVKSYRPFGGPQSFDEPVKSEVISSDIEDLQKLYELAKNIRAKRYATAGFDWTWPSSSVRILNQQAPPNPDVFALPNIPSCPQLFSGSLSVDYCVSSSPATLTSATMVAEFMILAGRLAASFCSERNIPMIYRGSTAPKPVATNSTLDQWLSLRIPGMGIIDPYVMAEPGWYRSSAFVSLKPSAHWIMGFDAPGGGYVRATSPLRRFDDMLVHWQIKAALAKDRGETGKLAKSLKKEEIVTLAQRSDEGSKRAKRAGVNAELFWKTQVINKHFQSPNGWPVPGRSVKEEEGLVDVRGEMIARIAGVSESSVFGEWTTVAVESLGIHVAKMEHPAGKFWKMGEEVRVRLKRSEGWPNPRITLTLAE